MDKEFRPVRYGGRRRLDPDRSGGLIGVAGVVCVLFLDLATMALFPWWGTTILLVLGAFLLLSAFAWFTPRPRRAVWLPVVGGAAWLVGVLLVLA